MAYEFGEIISPPTYTTEAQDDLMQKLLREKKAARQYVERRYQDWNENYELYRNKVKTNRLTQRQAVNIPLMKETVKTLLSKIDDPPAIDWQELGGDETKEIIFQEIWNRDFDRLNMEGIDIQDKKSVLLYGRGFKKLNWIDGMMDIRALDIYDIVLDPLTDPLDIETARFVIHQNIFRSLREILADTRYSAKGKERLKIWLSSKDGMVQSSQNRQEWEKKMERLRSLGVDHADFALFAGGDVIVNLTEHITGVWKNSVNDFERRVIVYADDQFELFNESLKDSIGVNFYPLVTWGEDIETQDFFSDSPADLVRTPNKILNVWFSQMVENRTLKNFQMHWYDATVQGYTPQTYEPGPGRMLPAPGDPNKTIMPVGLSGLEDTMQAIDFLTKIVESGTSATAIEKGVSEKKQITLGEVNVLVGKAMERTQAMAKFYRRSWQELAMKYQAMVNANTTGKMTLFKSDKNGKLWPLVVYSADWKSKQGYRANVRSSSEQEEEKTKGIQRFQALLQMFPGNQALMRIAQKRALEIVDLTPQEMREVEEGQNEVGEMTAAGTNTEQDQLLGSIQQRVNELQPQA